MLDLISNDTDMFVKDSVFSDYLKRYQNIAEDFKEQVLALGLPFSKETSIGVWDEKVNELEERGVVLANDRKSLSVGWVSPSCIICRKGLDSATFAISTQCNRNCFFCFNPNQKDYSKFRKHEDDPSAKLHEMKKQGKRFIDLALTGGEPLLHKNKTEEFFRQAKALYPQAYTRLYTSGDFLDRQFLKILQSASLDEIRISIKMDDSVELLEQTLDHLEMSKNYIPHVVVEMPVMPDQLLQMKTLLLALDEIGVTGINLLELCFPGHQVNEFIKRGYELKKDLFRVFYNYVYAGGFPVAGSEEVCLRLLEFALEAKLKMGLHYCSLENKFSGQVNLQNSPHADKYHHCIFSSRDYFFKSAKAFGNDVNIVGRFLEQRGLTGYRIDADDNFVEFSPAYLSILKNDYPDMEIGLSWNIVEESKNDISLRELRIDPTTPALFDISDI